MGKEQPLELKVEDGVLTITVGVDILAIAVDIGDDATVLDTESFANDILIELEQEADDGTTLVHRMFDEAANQAIENGSEAVSLEE